MSHVFASDKGYLIKYRGLIDVDGLFDLIHGWMMRNDFTNFNENNRKMKIPEIEIDWSAFNKRTEYIKETVSFNAHFWGLKPVEVVKEGKKVKMYKGRCEMRFGFVFETDWEGRWEKSAFWVKLRNFYDDYIIKHNLLVQYVDPLEDKMRDLHKEVKDFLGMEGA